MLIVPFATKNDTFEALKRADFSAGDFYFFLGSGTLLAEHESTGNHSTLRTTWAK
jgi:hypothetical protein